MLCCPGLFEEHCNNNFPEFPTKHIVRENRWATALEPQMLSALRGLAGKGSATDEAAANSSQAPYAFDATSGGNYTYPNLFQEADEMLVVALLMYIMTDLRAMAKQKQLKHGPERILNLPTTLEATLACIEENAEQMRQEEESSPSSHHEMALAALKSIQERFETSSSQQGVVNTTWLNPFGAARKKGFEPATLIAFGDEKADKELVYAVAVDPLRKRITVAFRGSVTPSDFITDACIEFNHRENPVKGENGQEEMIGIHHGFDEYLLKRRKAGDKGCKYDEIMNYVVSLFEEKDRKKDYKLYTTGHSLGGALASLFAFEAAAEGKVPLPVTCVSVASPRVGDESFQKAFSHLERAGSLRHLRIAHAQDPVTMMPKTSSTRMLALLSPVAYLAMKAQEAKSTSRGTYRHTGVKLRLLSEANKNGNTTTMTIALSCCCEPTTRPHSSPSAYILIMNYPNTLSSSTRQGR